MQENFPELEIIFSIDYIGLPLCLMEQEPYQHHLNIRFLNVIFLLKINLIYVFLDKNLTMANIRYNQQNNCLII